MSKQLFPMSDAGLEKQRKRTIGYRARVEKVEATLKARYGDAYKRWPEDYRNKKDQHEPL